MSLLIRLLLLFRLITAYQLPSPYLAKPPYSFGHYCNGTDPYWWEGALFVDLWGTLDVYENCTIRVTQFDSIEVHNGARLLAEPDARLVLQNRSRASFYADTILRNSSSLTLSDYCSLETKSGLILGLNSNASLSRFSLARAEGGLKLSDRSKLLISDFSQLLIGNRGNLSLNAGSQVVLDAFSSLIISANAGLRTEADSVLTLRGHATLEIGNNTWVRLARNALIPEHTRLLVSGGQDQNDSRLMGFEYITEADFGK